MKRYQYALAIVAGLVIGALVALKVGNYLTAVLAGSLTALVSSGIISLEWERAKKNLGALAAQTSQRISRLPGWVCGLGQSWVERVREQDYWWEKAFVAGAPITFPLVLVLGAGILVAGAVIFCVAVIAIVIFIMAITVFAAIRWIVKRLIFNPLATLPLAFGKNEPEVRKVWCYHLVLALLTAATLPGAWQALLMMRFQPGGVLWFTCPFLTLEVMAVFVSSLYLARSLFEFYRILSRGRKYCNQSWRLGDELRVWLLNDWSTSWWYHCDCSIPRLLEKRENPWVDDGLTDNRTALGSTIYMLAIRTFNIFCPLLWLGLFLFWLPRALASQKTGLAALASGGLSALHLLISYEFGWIEASNPNFWLSLGLAVASGAILGRKISAWQELKIPAFPACFGLKHKPLIS